MIPAFPGNEKVREKKNTSANQSIFFRKLWKIHFYVEKVSFTECKKFFHLVFISKHLNVHGITMDIYH